MSGTIISILFSNALNDMIVYGRLTTQLTDPGALIGNIFTQDKLGQLFLLLEALVVLICIKRLRSTRGEGYIDISVAVLVVMILLVAVIKIAPVFITKMTINNYANELCREAEIAGRVGTETTTRLDRLNESHPDLNPTITWSKTGNPLIMVKR